MQTRFILIETSHAGNVGAAARALKVMGFDDLVLVAPRWPNVLRKEETIQRASGAIDVLAKARVVDTLEEAVAVSLHAAATELAASAALQRLLTEEPGAILPFLSFEGLQPLLDRVSAISPALFGQFGSAEQARSAGDWIARVVLGHLRSPGGPIDLTDIVDCHRLVGTFFTATSDQPTTSARSAITC